MEICENCGCKHDESYGSGRFCSEKCARGFSTKANRSLINEKLSNILKEKYPQIIKTCKYCNKEFIVPYKRRKRVYCSRSCSAKSSETRKKISEQMKGKNSGKNNGMYGKSPPHTKSILVFSNKHTKKKTFYVRSSYEKIFIDQINENNSIKKFTYEPENFRVSYKDENGLERTYQPDFLVNNIKIVEIKNLWNAELEETKIKEKAFKKNFPIIKYTILKW